MCVCCSLKVVGNVKNINILEHPCYALFLWLFASADGGIYPDMLYRSLLQVISIMKKILPSVHLFMAVRYIKYI